MTEIIIVTAAFDSHGGEWIATSGDVAGLRLTADSWAGLIERLPAAVHERLSSTARRRREIAIEVLLHTSLNVTVDAPAKYHVGHSTGRRLPSTDRAILWADPIGARRTS